jgi:tRNA dimethylallyltransferase
MSTNYDLLVITGPTASGKTILAANIARRIEGEILSADSRQVYREMNIGTGKDYDDYSIDGQRIQVHLIDIVDPGYKFNVFEYQKKFLDSFLELKSRNKFPIVCGGSGMYIDSIVSGYKLIEVPPDENLRNELEKKTMEELTSILQTYKNPHNTTDIDTKKRAIRAIEIENYYSENKQNEIEFPHFRSLITGVKYDRESRRKMISKRLRERLANGMIEEVKMLIDKGIQVETLLYYGLEYKFITLYLTGKMPYEEMFCRLEVAIHQFAKRQMTWFRGMERRGIKIHWLDGFMTMEEKVERILELLKTPNSLEGARGLEQGAGS